MYETHTTGRCTGGLSGCRICKHGGCRLGASERSPNRRQVTSAKNVALWGPIGISIRITLFIVHQTFHTPSFPLISIPKMTFENAVYFEARQEYRFLYRELSSPNVTIGISYERGYPLGLSYELESEVVIM